MNNWNAKWIKAAGELDACPEFVKEFDLAVLPERATLRVTATGIYEVFLNGQRVGTDVLAPGWTSYDTRHRYQEYDVTALLWEHNVLTIGMGGGWYNLCQL